MPKKYTSKIISPGVRPRGNSIEIDLRVSGVRLRKTLSLNPNLKQDREEAIDIRHAIRRELKNSDKPDVAKYFTKSKIAIEKFGSERPKTLNDAINRWLETKKNGAVRRLTIKTYTGRVKFHISKEIGLKILRHVTDEHVSLWITNKNLNPKTKNELLSILRQTFKMAKKNKWIVENIMDDFDSFKLSRKKPKPFTLEEMEKIYLQADKELKPIIKFWAWVGPRTAEIFALRWSDINFDKQWVRIINTIADEDLEEETEERTKNEGSTRKVKLFSPALEALEAQKKYTGDNEFIFTNPSTGSLWNASEFRRKWAKILKETSVKYRRPYNLRHTYASVMLSAGESPEYVRTQMGHSSLKEISETYGSYIEDAGELSGSRINELLDKRANDSSS